MENINNSKYECCSPYFPTRSMCDLCEEMWNNEDLKLVDDKWLCEDCEDEYIEMSRKRIAEAQLQLRMLI